MADEMPRADEVTNLTPEEVAAGLREGRILLVDVREPNETSVESYPDAVIVPLSCFDPAAIPDPARKAGRVCLPFRSPFHHSVCCCSRCRLSVCCASCGWHYRVESSWPAHEDLNGLN